MSKMRAWTGDKLEKAWARWRLYILKTQGEPMSLKLGESVAAYTSDPDEREELAVMSFVHQTMFDQSKTLEELAVVTVDVNDNIKADFRMPE